MSATHVIATGTDLADQNASAPDQISPEDPSGDNPWITFFDAMQNAPRDEHWEEFMRVMKERPMNQLPIDRNLFKDSE